MSYRQTFSLLEGMRILDLADEKASFCTKLLADLGAQIIKVERPGGDPARKMGPFSKDLPSAETSLFYSYHNTNKQSVTCDLEKKEGQELFLRLLDRYDIVVETFPPGYLEEHGLGYDMLRARNPRVILVSVTGFGQEGPRSRYKSCDLVASAVGGQMYVSGSPEGPPLKAFGEQSYYAASLFAAVGILLAFRKQRQTGKGEHIDISLQEAVASTLDHVMVRYFQEKVIARRGGSRYWNNNFCILPCKDGHMLVTLFQQWETLIEWMAGEGMAEDLTDNVWKDDEYRRAHVDHVLQVVERWTRTHNTKELFELGQLMRFPWAPIESLKEVLANPQLEARRFFVEAADSNDPGGPIEASSVAYPGIPYRFSQLSVDRPNRAPRTASSEECGVGHRPDQRTGHGSAPGILSGVRVLDFTRVLAGPYATRLLADFGAEVIKVQSRKTATGAESNETPYFTAWNRNKLSITLDMSHAEAREIVLRLTAISDVVIENFSPRVMSNWSLDYARLREARSDIIMVSLSAMGQDGPWKDLVAFGPTLQALSGLTYRTSSSHDAPTGLGYAHADPVAGLYAALAILAALEHRDKTGQGQYIDLSEFEAVCTLLGPALMDARLNERDVLPLGNSSPHIPASPYGCFRCRGEDRWCVIAVFSEEEWHALRKVMGDPAWTREPGFSSLAKRKEHEAELNTRLEEWTIQRPSEKIVQLLQEAGIAAGVVQDAEHLANDPHLAANQFLVASSHPVFGNIFQDRSPIRFTGDTKARFRPAPSLGEHNRYVFTELLGLTEDELAAYIEKGIIG